MAWRYMPTLGVMGGVVAAHLSLRDCVSPSYSSTEGDGGGVPTESACAIGTTQSCNSYGTQTCLASTGLSLSLGAWGPCSCSSSPVCTPGGSQSCGNCGTETCNSCGQFPTCVNQGLCTPGDKGPDGCYEGEDALCNDSCQWVCP